MSIVGPAASTPDDLAITYRVMSQPDPDDPTQSLFAPSMAPDPSAKKYIGIHRKWLNQTEPRVMQVVQKAIDYLTAEKGYEVVEIDIPCLREGQLAHSATCLTEGTDDIRTFARDGSNWLPALSYSNQVLLSLGSHCQAVDFLKYSQIRQLIMRHMAYLFETYPGLLVVTPTLPLAGVPIHPGDQRFGVSDANRTVLSMTYCWLANTTGCPAVTCPAGYLDPDQGEGPLPVGIMATGEWGAEEQLLGFAKETEAYLNDVYPGGRKRPAEWADVFKLAKENKEKKESKSKDGNGTAND